jgi:MFS family permease
LNSKKLYPVKYQGKRSYLLNKKVHYGWIILFLSFLAIMATQGIRLSFGAFLVSWEQSFSTNRGTLSLISSLSFIVYGISQPLIGRWVDRYGVRFILATSTLLAGIGIGMTAWMSSVWQLAIAFGIIASLGFGGASSVAASVAVTNWFQKKRGFALGLITSGFGAGQFVWVPLSLYLIDGEGWVSATAILAGILIVGIFPLLWIFLRNHPSEKGLNPYGDGDPRNFSMDEKVDNKRPMYLGQPIKYKAFWFLILPYFVCGFTTTGLMDVHLVPFAHHHGISTPVTSLAVSLLAAFNIIGTLISGYLTDRIDNQRFLMALYMARFFTLIFLAQTTGVQGLIVFSILFGLVDFATVAPTSLLATRYFEKYGWVLGWLSLGHQAGSALGAYIPGLLFDQTGNYQITLYIATAMLLAAVLFSAMLPKVQPKTTQKSVSSAI